MKYINHLINFEIFHLGKYSLNLGMVITVVLIIILTKFLLWMLKKFMFRKSYIDQHKKGNLFSLFQIIRYVIWIITILLILDTLGVQLNVLLAGSAALLVGLGLGLQKIFNDFISGIILLFEGSIQVGDILEINKDILKIQNIGLRTSEAINRDNIIAIIPNSIITSNTVINWSHQTTKTRFRIKIGVAYGSEVELVEKILKESALEHPEVEKKSLVIARFVNFGSSSLDFELLFYSHNIFRVENIKSDIRKIINQKFIENNITIPFTQMDLHIKR